MKKKIIGGIILLVIIVPQFIPVDKPEINEDKSNDLITNNEIPGNIANMLKTSCYDCHSNQTVYPWYADVAPVSWLVIRDVKVGRKELNFSDWETLSKMDKAKLLDDISEEVEDEEMPMPIYFVTHSDAKLSEENRAALVNWSEAFAESLFKKTTELKLPERQVDLEYFETEVGWGYKIIINDKDYITQKYLPCKCGGKGFENKEKAALAAEFLKKKIENNERSLLINRAQLDSLGAI